ncbi:MAG: SGNH/GDSL hydrolase family protein [Oscillospiraceae bacterium]|nr:SGNH/GDSL hydrolase family protein [Oscillospiraceae bacterium]
MDFSKLNFGVDGDSITAGQQWSWHVFNTLGMASHHNVAVGSAVWYKRTITCPTGSVTTQNYDDPDFAGISDGWEPTEDLAELQKRANNCAVVHVQKFLSDVKNGIAPVPDVFAFAMGTNDSIDCLGNADTALKGKSLDGNPNVNLFTEAGAMRWCLQTIMEAYPPARVFVLTPLQTAMPDHNEKIEIQINTVMRKIAGAMNAQIIDCFHNCGICEKFEVEGAMGKYLRDGLHPDVPGQVLEGAYAAKEIRNNMF